ncbi:hypothetical protein PtB15_12B189 [Puccinia triticina]|nr:hypothetical protein PtB15_12B189 [Puccinia triticina]
MDRPAPEDIEDPFAPEDMEDEIFFGRHNAYTCIVFQGPEGPLTEFEQRVIGSLDGVFAQVMEGMNDALLRMNNVFRSLHWIEERFEEFARVRRKEEEQFVTALINNWIERFTRNLEERFGLNDHTDLDDQILPDARPVVAPDARPVVAPDARPVVAPDAHPVAAPDAHPVAAVPVNRSADNPCLSHNEHCDRERRRMESRVLGILRLSVDAERQHTHDVMQELGFDLRTHDCDDFRGQRSPDEAGPEAGPSGSTHH